LELEVGSVLAFVDNNIVIYFVFTVYYRQRAFTLREYYFY